MGNDIHDGIFGCHPRVFLARRDGSAWTTPVQIGEGEVLFAFDGERRVVVLTTFGAWISDDDGESFVRRAEVNGSGAAWTGKRLVVARVHDGIGGGAAVVFSEDEGENWNAPRVLLAEPTWAAPFVASDGANLVLAVALQDAIVLTRSADHGDTWTKPHRVARAPGEELAGVAVAGHRVGWLLVGDRYRVCTAE
jgi:photosystem II stability/assembly factor-like uncharacterized protein